MNTELESKIQEESLAEFPMNCITYQRGLEVKSANGQ